MPPHPPALDSRAILEQLIRVPTVSREPNLALIAYVRDYLEAHGIASTLIHDETGTKANLLATIGPRIDGGVVLSGHTDVVPVDGQAWTSDPFRLVERDGRLYGRGTADMKTFIAVALAAVPRFLARPLARPIHLAFSYDEEIGCIGVRRLIAHARTHLPKPMAVIVGEPTEMGVVNAHKGSRRFETVVTGLEAHSSQTQAGANAIDAAARLITFLQSLADEMVDRGDTTGRFMPPYSTIQVGMISGGTAPNIIPRECRFVWEFRLLPDAAPDEIIARFDAFAGEKVAPGLIAKSPLAGVVTRELGFAPPLAAERDAPAETLAYRLVGKNEPQAVAFTTEAGLFQEADMSAVVCGPGSIAQAHKPDEYIELEQIVLCEQMMLRLADIMAA